MGGRRWTRVSHGVHPASRSLRAVTANQSHAVETPKPSHNNSMMMKAGLMLKVGSFPVIVSKKPTVPKAKAKIPKICVAVTARMVATMMRSVMHQYCGRFARPWKENNFFIGVSSWVGLFCYGGKN